MARKITLTGKNARYIEHRGADAPPDDDREIRMEGDDAQYEEHAYGSTESPMQQQKQYDLTEMTSAVDRVRQFFWSESAMAFIFCVCRDCFNYANNMSQFEREFNCREGLLSNTFRNNPYMYLSVDKWAENGAKERVLRLVDAYKDAIKEGPLEQNRQNY